MERRGSNHDAQKTAILGLLGYSILAVDGRDLNPSIPYPYFITHIVNFDVSVIPALFKPESRKLLKRTLLRIIA
jgi:hypothetical protein